MKPVVWLGSSKADLKAFPAAATDDTGHHLFRVQRGLDNGSPESPGGHHMAKRKAHSVFRDLYPADQAAEMEMRSLLLQGLGNWLADSGMTQTEAAKILAVTQARVSDIKRGKISSFSLDLLVRLAARAGLNPKLKLVA